MSDASVRQGTVARLTSEAVTLIVDGATMALATQDIRRIETPDRMSDGVSKGAIGLAIVGGVGTGLLEYSLCAHDCAFSTMKTGFVGAALGAALGAVMGGVLDVANPAREVIFERTSVSIAPVMTRRSRSVSLVVRW